MPSINAPLDSGESKANLNCLDSKLELGCIRHKHKYDTLMLFCHTKRSGKYLLDEVII